MSTTTFSADLDPETKLSISMRLYKNVKNVPKLRSEIIAGTLQCCIIKPSLIVNPLHVVIAANKAALSQHYKQLTTRSVYTEILFNLSISKNISQSLLKFGIDDKEMDILVAVFHKVNDASENNVVFDIIEGDLVNFDEIQNLTNEQTVKKSYKIQNDESQVSTLINSVISRIATKDFVSH